MVFFLDNLKEEVKKAVVGVKFKVYEYIYKEFNIKGGEKISFRLVKVREK